MSLSLVNSSLTVLISPSLGACITIIVEPIAVKKQPNLPIVLNFSFRKYADNMALINTDNAPRGVTNVAGTKPYAAKLQISPMPT